MYWINKIEMFFFRRRGRPPSTATFVAPDLSSEDPEKARYRRMRDLNNEASRRCRLNRKRKFETIDHELQYEQVICYQEVELHV